jgi:hypothetical protein
MSVENKSVDINSETDEAIKYCVECGAKMSKKVADLPRLWRKSDLRITYYFCLNR